jgi:hypothetical protein
MQRRTFIALFGAAAVPWPFAARAQQAMPTVGFIRSSAEAGFDHLVAAFRLGLSDAGYVDGRTIKIELRWGDGSKERLSTLATELVRNDVKVIVGNASAMEAVMAATKTVPIVFVSGNDPVTGGLVANLHRPGGNITGVSYFEVPLAAKRLELLTELLPKAGNIAALINPNFTGAQSEQQHLETAARAMGRKMLIVSASTEDAIDGRRDRRRICAAHPSKHRCLARRRQPVFRRAAAANHDAGSPARHARHLRSTRICRGRRAGELWRKPDRRLSTRRQLCQPHSQGRTARRPAGRIASQVRVDHQPADGEGAWHRNSHQTAVHRR